MISKLLAGRWGPVIWLTCLALLGVASMIPFRLPGSFLDKMLHLVAYFALTTLAFRVWPACRRRTWLAMGLLLVFGAGIETAQRHLAGREASWLDLTSNALGIFLALLLTSPSSRPFTNRPGLRRASPVGQAANPKA